jgi:hypothetical protein
MPISRLRTNAPQPLPILYFLEKSLDHDQPRALVLRTLPNKDQLGRIRLTKHL